MKLKKANYGIDAPGVVRNLLLFGGALFVGGFALAILASRGVLNNFAFASAPFVSIGSTLLLTGAIMLWGSKFGKLRLRDKIINSLNLRGDEQVLDVGCGHGLMLIGAAKRLTNGKATGIDIWQAQDQAGNSEAATLANVEAENVANRVEIKNADARTLPFADATFDVIVSSWALHNIYEKPEREKALREIVRVLKPDGKIAVADISHAREYADIFQKAGLKNVGLSRPYFLFVIPTRIVFGVK